MIAPSGSALTLILFGHSSFGRAAHCPHISARDRFCWNRCGAGSEDQAIVGWLSDTFGEVAPSLGTLTLQGVGISRGETRTRSRDLCVMQTAPASDHDA
jgi:hypothetical protein